MSRKAETGSLPCVKTALLGVLCIVMSLRQSLAGKVTDATPNAQGSVSESQNTGVLEDYPRKWLPEDRLRPVPCGPACMAMALRILDVEFEDSEVSSLCDKDGVTDFGTLYDYARGKGLFAEAVRILPQDLTRLRNVAILQQFPSARGTSPGQGNHLVVFAGPAKRPGYVYIYDPISANGWRGAQPLELLSHKLTGNALVISRFPLDLSELLGKG